MSEMVITNIVIGSHSKVIVVIMICFLSLDLISFSSFLSVSRVNALPIRM